jgi:hypothetical protein
VLCRTCHMQEHHGRRVDWSCPICNKTLSLVPSNAKTRHYCSAGCRNTGRARKAA